MPKLFAIYLGGRAANCNTELHDVIFTSGTDLKSLYPKAVAAWFGLKTQVHIDSYVALEIIDGYEIAFSDNPSSSNKQLYFINLGGYKEGHFTEFHENIFVVCESEKEAKIKAKEKLMQNMLQVHTDDIYDVDDCIRIDKVDGYYLNFKPTEKPEEFNPTNGYFKIPDEFKGK